MHKSALIILVILSIGLTIVTRDPYLLSLMKWMAVGALIAASMRLVMLFGELNMATAAFVGIGAYSAAVALTMFNLPFYLTLVIAGVTAAVVSLPFGFVTLRTKGPYFKLIGFAFAEVVRIILTQSQIVGGNSGIIGVFPPTYLEQYFPTFVVGVVTALIFLMYRVEKSDYGNLLAAIKDNDAVVQTVGINVHLVKVACFALASFIAGIAGALQAYSNNVISPGDFTFFLSVYALAYLKIGGEKSIFGPVVGAIVLIFIGSIALTYGSGELVIYGGAIVLGALFMPDGIVGVISALWARVFNRDASSADRKPAAAGSK
jgi:branched-chain amino acid transport system permease protein